MANPRFTQALDNLQTAADGYTADCPICRQNIHIQDIDGYWTFGCGNCTHDEIAHWIGADDLRTNPEAGVRAWVALMLAPTPEIWEALLLGEPVAEQSLDQNWLRRFKAGGIM